MATDLQTDVATRSRTRKIPPLENGDRLTGPEFLRRYEAMPDLKKAELIEGVVHKPAAAVSQDHAGPNFIFNGWMFFYQAHTRGTEGGDNATLKLGLDNLPQPDGFLRITPECGGQSRTEDRYVIGAPELIGEISATTASRDLNVKLNVYRKHGVTEYVVWRVFDEALDWFVLRDGQYERLPLVDGLYQSEVFPGLWLDAAAMIGGDLARGLQIAQQGIATPEHAEFVRRLQQRQ
ncbi:MAG: Uma2 family endonuclease [Planctomycetaceae bacterium]